MKKNDYPRNHPLPKGELISIYVDSNLKTQIENYAHSIGMTPSSLGRHLFKKATSGFKGNDA